MGLLLLVDLQPVLNPPEEPVCPLQGADLGQGQELQLRYCAQGFQGARLLEKGVMCAVHELQGLHYKLDLANTAGAKFHVQLVGRNLPFNPPLDRGNLIEQLGSRGPRENEWLMLSQK